MSLWWAHNNRHKRGDAPASNGPAFDLSGDLSVVPTAYLIVVVRRGTGKIEVIEACAKELERRGEMNPTIRREAGGRCRLCPRKGIYIVGLTLYCSKHRDEGSRHLAATAGHIAHRRNKAIDAEANDRDRTMRNADQCRARARGMKHKGVK